MSERENLPGFRMDCRRLLAEGIKPTATEFAKRGWPCVTVANNRYYARQGHPPTPNPGSGTTWIAGKYAIARREELLKAGWTFKEKPNARFEGQGRWVPPNA